MSKPKAEFAAETVALSPEQTAARRRRNAWIALAIGAFVVLVFLITMTRLQAGTP